MTAQERAKQLEEKLHRLYGFRTTQANVCWAAEALDEIEAAVLAAEQEMKGRCAQLADWFAGDDNGDAVWTGKEIARKIRELP